MKTFYSLNCRGTLLDLSEPLVMGILNLTPDSFFDGGQLNDQESVIHQAGQMLDEGAKILDLGGMSSRPGAELISAEEEINRVLPAVQSIRTTFPEAILSIDTIHSSVAKACLEAGAHIINDISAWSYDSELPEVAAEYGAPYILMHKQGDPANMQIDPNYQDLLSEIMTFFISKIEDLKGLGIYDVVIDPGFGFGKTVEHNYSILKNLEVFQILECPVLAGLSRKSMINKVLKTKPENALNGTSALHMIALQQGARILRVHDVREAVECITLWKTLESV